MIDENVVNKIGKKYKKVSCDLAGSCKMYILKQGVAIPKIVKKVWIVESVINIYYLSV